MTTQTDFVAPEKLRADHDLSHFANGKYPSLDHWLKERAAQSEGLSARTYVLCRRVPVRRVVGYYALATATAQRTALPSARLRRQMPDEIPLFLIGRLALDASLHGQGIGTFLLADAIRRCLAVSEIAGVRAIISHAVDDAAMGFYQRHGFIQSPLGPRVMVLPIEIARGMTLS